MCSTGSFQSPGVRSPFLLPRRSPSAPCHSPYGRRCRFYFKTNPLTLETTQTKHQHLNYSPVFSLLGLLLYTSSPRFLRASRSWSQGPSHRPTLLEEQGCQQRVSVTWTLALLIILPRTLTSLRRKLRGQGFVKCDSPQETCSSSGVLGSTPHHTTLDDL